VEDAYLSTVLLCGTFLRVSRRRRGSVAAVEAHSDVRFFFASGR
jgi:hypothetical protein